MSRSPMFHVGIVVPNLASATERFTELLDVTWGPIVEYEQMQLRAGDGTDLVVPSRLCYSTEAPYLELIQEAAGSPWECNEHSNLHHIGFFTDDLAASTAAFAERACPLEYAGRMGDTSPVTFTVHSDPLGVRIESLDISMQKMVLERFCQPPA